MEQLGLNLGGWIFLIAAWGSILAITIFCFWRVLESGQNKKE
jgi:hypothetical protein